MDGILWNNHIITYAPVLWQINVSDLINLYKN